VPDAAAALELLHGLLLEHLGDKAHALVDVKDIRAVVGGQTAALLTCSTRPHKV
jgi:hypothetical protein